MTTITEGLRTGEHLVSEARGYRSREQVALATGIYAPGQVLGATKAATATAVAGANTGTGAMGAITTTSDAIQGAYLLKFTKAAAGAGDFEVIDPQGDVSGVGTAGQPFAGGGLSFTLAVGGTNWAVGDSFSVTVGAPSVVYKAHDPAATDGSQHAAGVLLAGVTLTAPGRGVAHLRSCEVNGQIITWKTGITGPQKSQGLAELADRGIIVR